MGAQAPWLEHRLLQTATGCVPTSYHPSSLPLPERPRHLCLCNQVWDDGTLAAPLAALKEDAGDASPPGGTSTRAADRADAADPDFSIQAEAAGHSGEEGRGGSDHRPHSGRGGGGGSHHHGGSSHGGGGHGATSGRSGERALSEEDEEALAYSSDSPRVSV